MSVKKFFPRFAMVVIALASIVVSSADSGLCAGREPSLKAGSRPNILLIVADDMGQTDLGTYGGEINTPNLDRLAAQGTLLTNFYSAPLCAPTRSMLLSGTDNHRAGEGRMDTNVEGVDGYEGYLNHRVVSLATRLKSVGYHTYMAGKWHLGQKDDQSAAARGFERSFTLLAGAADHFELKGMGGQPAQYRDDGKLVKSLPEDFYSTTYYTDKMLGYMKESAKDDKPFFAYLAYTSPHWPMQAPDEDIARQRGKYDEGYEVLRQKRFEAWKALGFAPQDTQLPNLSSTYTPWGELSPEQQAKSSRAMEVYAAMVERMDMEIGRILAYLKESGQLDNTLIMFESDNGAEGGSGGPGGANNNIALDGIGRPGSWVYVGEGWAQAQAAPYYLYKTYTAEGGIHVPAFVYGPSLGVPSGVRDDSVLIASDVAPTFLELAGGSIDAPSDRPDALPITGRSFAGILRGDNQQNRRGTDDMLGWEHSGQAAIRKGDWKLLWVGTRGAPGNSEAPGGRGGGAQGAGAPGAGVPGAGAQGAGAPGMGRSVKLEVLAAGDPEGVPVGKGGPWKLFNVREDPSELHDLSLQEPEIKAQMLAEWNRYVAENGVIVKMGTTGK